MDDDDVDADGDGDDVFRSLYTFVSKRECEKFTWGILLYPPVIWASNSACDQVLSKKK